MTHPTQASFDRSSGQCRLCGSSVDQRPLVREEKMAAGQWLVQCGLCQALYLAPDLTAEGTEQFYAHSYRQLYPFESTTRPDEAFLYAIRCREIGFRRAQAVAAIAPPSARVLEVGSGYGGFLAGLQRLRPDLTLAAIEPDTRHRTAALIAQDITFLSWDTLKTEQPFEIIAAFHTLEHLLAPVESLATLAKALASGGRVLIEVPETDPSALSHADIHPAHLTVFTPATLFQTVERAGLRVCAARCQQASLPKSLWIEAEHPSEHTSALPCPAASAPARVPPPTPVWKKVLRSVIRHSLPSEWVGRLSRWRHGPALDDSLSEFPRRVFRWGIPFALWTMDTLIEQMVQNIAEARPFRVADINVAKLTEATIDPAFRQSVLSAETTTVDGMGVVWGLKALGVACPQRVSGCDVLERVMALCAERGFRPYLLGSKPDVLERAISAFQHRYPGLQMAGSHHGYFAADEEAALIEGIARTKPDFLIVAMSTPQQDHILTRFHQASGAAIAFGVGGSLDVAAGNLRRAPLWAQNAGCEWLYRLAQEPRRLGLRYLRTNSHFALLLAQHWLARKLARR